MKTKLLRKLRKKHAIYYDKHSNEYEIGCLDDLTTTNLLGIAKDIQRDRILKEIKDHRPDSERYIRISP